MALNKNVATVGAAQKSMLTFMRYFPRMELEKHYINRSNWLRAAVLGMNDGIISTSSIAIAVSSASAVREPVLLATLAGLVAGAFAMAAGEYVSVSSQADVEKADIERERRELEKMPEVEMNELKNIYIKRGLTEELAGEVARQLHAHDALAAHIHDELGINEMSEAKPVQAALASAVSFLSGGILPLLVVLLAPMQNIIYLLYGATILFLAASGYLAARAGGSNPLAAVMRICFWGTLAMVASALTGRLFGVQLG